MKFDLISSISVEDESSWRDKVFLTFDIDWAHDRVVMDTIDLVENFGAVATWFMTHESPAVERRLRAKGHEVGLHPNFRKLFVGDHSNGSNPQEVLARLLEVFPDARSVRSHSLVQSSEILDLYRRNGLSHDVSLFLHRYPNLEISPFRDWNCLVRVPYQWEDDVHAITVGGGAASDSPKEVADYPGLRVINFHPIHVFLNTESMERYERTRPVHSDPDALRKERWQHFGTRTLLEDLLIYEGLQCGLE